MILQSFDFRTLHAMKKLAPEIPRSALYEGKPRDFVDIARDADAQIVSPDFHLVTPEQVRAAHAAGLLVAPWTPDTPQDWDRLIAAGVDAIITDYPATLIDVLKSKSLALTPEKPVRLERRGCLRRTLYWRCSAAASELFTRLETSRAKI